MQQEYNTETLNQNLIIDLEMKKHGEILRGLMKARGYDIKGLSNVLGITRVSVEKDLIKEQITRRSLAKYMGVLFDSFEDFYADRLQELFKPALVANSDHNISDSDYMDLQKKYIDLQTKFIELQDRHLKLTERFFPSAAQRMALG